MSDYISREAAIEAVREELGCETCNGSNVGIICAFCNVGEAILMIKNIPAADVEPVRHVRRKVWGIDEYYGEWLQCPRCLYSENASNAKYCGGCGAKIDLALPEGDSHG